MHETRFSVSKAVEMTVHRKDDVRRCDLAFGGRGDPITCPL